MRLMSALPQDGFTAHNVRFDDGTQTYPEAGATIDQTGDYRCVKNMLQVLYPAGHAGKSIVDLGCLESGFTAEFARLGLDSTGIEVRDSNLRNARYIQERLNLPNLRFHQDDAWNVGQYGPFDIVFCVGLYYHIGDSRRFLGCCPRPAGRRSSSIPTSPRSRMITRPSHSTVFRR